MHRNKRRRLGLQIDSIPYINHLKSNKKVKKVKNDGEKDGTPNTWEKFVEDSNTSSKCLTQDGGTCTIYAMLTAQMISSGKDENIKLPHISSKIKSEGVNLSEITRPPYLATDYTHVKSVNISLLSPRDQINKIIELLEEGIVVAGITCLGSASLCENVPMFGTNTTIENQTQIGSHTVCIIGCYKDKDYGSCFITKMTNRIKDFDDSKLYSLIPTSIFSKAVNVHEIAVFPKLT